MAFYKYYGLWLNVRFMVSLGVRGRVDVREIVKVSKLLGSG